MISSGSHENRTEHVYARRRDAEATPFDPAAVRAARARAVHASTGLPAAEEAA